MNTAKTNYILFGRYNRQQNVAIIINRKTILLYRELKPINCLGVLTDESLNWKNHINMAKSK